MYYNKRLESGKLQGFHRIEAWPPTLNRLLVTVSIIYKQKNYTVALRNLKRENGFDKKEFRHGFKITACTDWSNEKCN